MTQFGVSFLSRAVLGALLLGALTSDAFPAGGDAGPNLNDVVSGVPAEYRHRLVQQLSVAEDQRDAWLAALARTAPDKKEAVAFLLTNMPERDLKSLPPDRLLKDVDLAYDAESKAPWGASIPKEIFLNDVLPYANLNERRDDWRGDFAARFGPLVKDCKTASDAAQVLNREVFKRTKVSYHATKRPKPDQSPYESIDAHYASCSGLSILLADACRSVGVPARLAGTPLWADSSGNHTWVEVWDGQWYFIGAAEPGPLNQTWFGEMAAKAAAAGPGHGVFAASFRHTSTTFPLVWDPTNTDYPAVNVNAYYAKRQPLKVSVVGPDGKPAAGCTVRVRLGDELVAQREGPDASFDLGAGCDYEVSGQSAGGTTPARKVHLPTDDGATVQIRTEPPSAQ